VGVRGDKIVILASPIRPITFEEALNLGAWLVAIADRNNQFPKLLEEIKNS
jgi:hypothetical protein